MDEKKKDEMLKEVQQLAPEATAIHHAVVTIPPNRMLLQMGFLEGKYSGFVMGFNADMLKACRKDWSAQQYSDFVRAVSVVLREFEKELHGGAN